MLSIVDDIDRYMAAVFNHIEACIMHARTTQTREFGHIGWHQAVQATLQDVGKTWQAVQKYTGQEGGWV